MRQFNIHVSSVYFILKGKLCISKEYGQLLIISWFIPSGGYFSACIVSIV